MLALRESGYSVVPWKNGGGVTREILRFPATPAPFEWRLSLASIDSPGPFSSFEGYDRTLLLVRGAGVRLSFGEHGEVVLNATGQTVSFDGAWQTDCTLLDGPSTDLNLMVLRARAESATHSIQLEDSQVIATEDWDERLVCCLSGELTLTNNKGEVLTLGAVDVARCSLADGAITCRRSGASVPQVFWAGIRQRAR